MEGWRQRRPGSNQKLLVRKTKTDLTLTGLLMEGLVMGWKQLPSIRRRLLDMINDEDVNWARLRFQF